MARVEARSIEHILTEATRMLRLDRRCVSVHWANTGEKVNCVNDLKQNDELMVTFERFDFLILTIIPDFATGGNGRDPIGHGCLRRIRPGDASLRVARRGAPLRPPPQPRLLTITMTKSRVLGFELRTLDRPFQTSSRHDRLRLPGRS